MCRKYSKLLREHCKILYSPDGEVKLYSNKIKLKVSGAIFKTALPIRASYDPPAGCTGPPCAGTFKKKFGPYIIELKFSILNC